MTYAWAMKRKTIDRDTMAEVLADLDPASPIEKEKQEETETENEKQFLPPRLPVEPKPSVLQKPQSIGLTLKAPPPRSWISLIVAAGLLAVALGFLGFQPNVEKWIGTSYNSISAAVRNLLVPSSAPVSAAPAPSVSPHNSSTTPMPEGLSDEKNVRGPQQGGDVSSASGGGQN
jgi:hypothetical protein